MTWTISLPTRCSRRACWGGQGAHAAQSCRIPGRLPKGMPGMTRLSTHRDHLKLGRHAHRTLLGAGDSLSAFDCILARQGAVKGFAALIRMPRSLSTRIPDYVRAAWSADFARSRGGRAHRGTQQAVIENRATIH